MIGMLWAQTRDRVIGRANKIPWRYPGDLRRFKRLTMGSVVVMGRLTYESIGKPLPGRTNIVVTSPGRVFDPLYLGKQVTIANSSTPFESVMLTASEASWQQVLDGKSPDIWFIGGARIYADAMAVVDVIDVTMVPDVVPAEGSVLAPEIDEAVFAPGPLQVHPDEPLLRVQRFTRRGP